MDTNGSKFEGYRLYCFFGYSASQLRNRSCLFVNKDADFWEDEKKFGEEFAEKVKLARPIKARRALITPKKIYEYFGHFDKIKVVAKYAARVGLLLSPTCLTISIPDHQWALERDWKTACGEYEFTDGCGRMSTNIARQFLKAIAEKNDGNSVFGKYEHQKHQVPSVIQFRMMGCKGILVHDPTLDDKDPLKISNFLIFPKSFFVLGNLGSIQSVTSMEIFKTEIFNGLEGCSNLFT